MALMIDARVAAFAGVAALLTILPGADTMLVIRTVMARGQRAGLLATVGICCGLFIHATLSALGLSLILVRSAAAYEVVKTIGAGYLVWLGIQSIRRAWHHQPGKIGFIGGAALPTPSTRGRQSLIEGLLSNVLNPKVAIFYLALLPQFIRPGDWVFGKSMLLAGIHWVEGIIWLSAVTIFLGRLRDWIGQPRLTRRIEAAAGTMLIMFGLKLAMDRR